MTDMADDRSVAEPDRRARTEPDPDVPTGPGRAAADPEAAGKPNSPTKLTTQSWKYIARRRSGNSPMTSAPISPQR